MNILFILCDMLHYTQWIIAFIKNGTYTIHMEFVSIVILIMLKMVINVLYLL